MRHLTLMLVVLGACAGDGGAQGPEGPPGEPGADADPAAVARALLDDPVMRAALIQLLADELGGASVEGEGEAAAATAGEVAALLRGDAEFRQDILEGLAQDAEFQAAARGTTGPEGPEGPEGPRGPEGTPGAPGGGTVEEVVEGLAAHGGFREDVTGAVAADDGLRAGVATALAADAAFVEAARGPQGERGPQGDQGEPGAPGAGGGGGPVLLNGDGEAIGPVTAVAHDGLATAYVPQIDTVVVLSLHSEMPFSGELLYLRPDCAGDAFMDSGTAHFARVGIVNNGQLYRRTLDAPFEGGVVSRVRRGSPECEDLGGAAEWNIGEVEAVDGAP